MPPCFDTITSQGTAIGASLAATTIAGGDSFQVKNAAPNSDIWLMSVWAFNTVAGMVRIRSPKLHDNVDAIRTRVLASDATPLLPLGTAQRMYSQDTEIVELAGSAVGGAIESVVELVYYSDLQGQSTRFLDPAGLKQRQKNLLGVRLALTYPTVVGYGGQKALNADVDLLKANTDYAVLGMTTSVRAAAICLRGPDTGNLRLSCPGETVQSRLYAHWFLRLSQVFNMPLIPIINSANKGATLVDAVSNDSGGTGNVTVWLAELG